MASGLTSTAIDRAPGPSKNFVRGKSGYVPFWPGGLEALLPEFEDADEVEELKGLRTVAPGLSRGLRLPGDEAEEDATLQELEGLQHDALQQHMVFSVMISSVLRMFMRIQDGQVPQYEDAPMANGAVGPGSSEIDELLPTSVSAASRTRNPHSFILRSARN